VGRAERHAQADLARADGDRVGHHGVEAEHREQQRDESLPGGERGAHAQRQSPKMLSRTCASIVRTL
jgi:hypothetical protein